MIKNTPIIFSILGALLVFNAEGMRVDSYPEGYVKVSFQLLLKKDIPLDQMTYQIFKELHPAIQERLFELISNQSNKELLQKLEKTEIALEQALKQLENIKVILGQEHQKSDERLAKINEMGDNYNNLKTKLAREKEQTRQLKKQLAAKDRSAGTKLEHVDGNEEFERLSPGYRIKILSNILGFLNSTYHCLPDAMDLTLEYLWELGLIAKTSESKHVVGKVTFYSARSSRGILFTPTITMSPCLWEQMFLHVDETNIAKFDELVLNYNQ